MKKSKNFFFSFRTFDLDVVWYRLIYGKASIWAGLKGFKHHMIIFFDIRRILLLEGSTYHFDQNPTPGNFFFQITKIVPEVDQVAIWISGTYKGHPKQLSNTLSAHVSEKKFWPQKILTFLAYFLVRIRGEGNYLGGNY